MNSKYAHTDQEIATRLAAELPRWSHLDGAIRRNFRTHGWKGTLMAVNAIGHLCEVAWHHPQMTITFDCIEVALWSHDAGGITERDFALAAKLDSVLDWQPGTDGGALEGTPSTPQHAYLRYDE